MSGTIAAALKKIAIEVLGNPKNWKKIGTAICVCLVVLFMPIIALVSLFSVDIEIDGDDILEIVENLDVEDVEKFTRFEEILTEIEDAMEDAGMGDRYEDAQLLFAMALYDHYDEDDFVDRLVGCFEEDQDDYELIENINDEFGTDIDAAEFIQLAISYRSSTINTWGFIDRDTRNNLDLCRWAWEAYNDEWGYVWATYGLVLTPNSLESLSESIPDHVGSYHDFIETHWVGRRTADCAGLIKGYWWFNFDTNEIVYGSNGFGDMDADSMYYNASESGTIDTMPDIPGLGLWHEGHVGIYVGNGTVIHASGTRSGVVKNLVENTTFTHWFYIPNITYFTPEDETPEETTVETTVETTAETTTEPTLAVPVETRVEETEATETVAG